MGVRAKRIAKSTLADANETRDWRIYADFAQSLIGIARRLYAEEPFFKWIKQHLRIKRFFGTSENAVKSQIWIAVSVYVLVAIVKKRLHLKPSLFQLLQVLSLTMFERTPLDQLLSFATTDQDMPNAPNQLTLHGI